MDNLKIIEVNYGLGSVYEDIIEIHYLLPDTLKEKIITHEKSHTKGTQYTQDDFKNDFQSKDSYFFESFIFCLRNLEAFIGFFPFMYSYYKKQWTWNFSALVPFLYFGIIFCALFAGFFKANFFMVGLGYTIMFICINIIMLILTHRIVAKSIGFVYKERRE